MDFEAQTCQETLIWFNLNVLCWFRFLLSNVQNASLSDHSKVSSKDALLDNAISKLRSATQFLTSTQSEDMPKTSLPLLQAIAEARYGLIVTAQYIYEMAQFPKTKKMKDEQVSFRSLMICCKGVECRCARNRFPTRHPCP